MTAHKKARFCVDTGRLMSCDSLKTARFKCVLSRHNVDSHNSNYKAPCTSGKSRPCIELLEHIPPDEHVEQVKLAFFLIEDGITNLTIFLKMFNSASLN